MIKDNPIIVNITRGSCIESYHRAHAIVVDSSGCIAARWGNPNLEIFPRSAIKPLQAISLLETGAAEHFKFSDSEIALVCSSHSGEAQHITLIQALLSRIGCFESNLQCGPHWPMDIESSNVMLQSGIIPSRVHNNCSGKHAGFLATASYLNESLENYVAQNHPVQTRVYRTLCEMGGCELSQTSRGVDGCGIPVYGMPLVSMALGLARIADPSGLSKSRQAAAKKIFVAMANNSVLIAGTGRFDTIAVTSGCGAFVCKGGAEGVHGASIAKSGLGIAVKVEDGGTRASEVAIAAILKFLSAFDPDVSIKLGNYLKLPIKNTINEVVGYISAEV